MENKKSIRKRIWDGIIAGLKVEVLPPHISKLDKNIYVRIFKIIGGTSMFIIVSGIGSQLNRIYFYIFIVFSLSYILYKYVITFYVLKQWIHNIKSGKLLVRKLPI